MGKLMSITTKISIYFFFSSNLNDFDLPIVLKRLCLQTEHSSLLILLQRNLLGDLCFFLEDGLLLSSETLLLVIVSSSSLGEEALFAFLVLRHFVLGVFFAVVGTVCVA